VTLVELQEVDIAWDGKAVLQGVHFTVSADDVWGVVGRNGSGKSSLLQTLAGSVPPHGGRVVRAPGVRTMLVHGAADDAVHARDLMEDALTAWREARDALAAEAERLADDPGRLDRYAAVLERFERLGGWAAPERHQAAWQKAVPEAALHQDRPLPAGLAQLARVVGAVLSRPDVLLLDEPTLPLDAFERERLARFLLRPPQGTAWVIASHDRALLKAVTRATARLHAGTLHARRLAYGTDEVQRDTAKRQEARRAREARKEAERLEAAAVRARRFGAAAKDAKRFAERAMQQQRYATVDATTLATRTEADVPGVWPTRIPAGTSVVTARSLGVASAFWGVHLDVRMGERWTLLGRSGAGASALLEVLAGVRPNDNPRATLHRDRRLKVHLWSDRRQPAGRTPLAWVAQGVQDEAARQTLLQTGLPHDAVTRTWETLSTGQKVRVRLAKMIAEQPDLVLLDRPERGLDLAGLEWLETALQKVPAAIILVTHDLALAEGVSGEVAELTREGLVRYRGGVEGWRHGRKRQETHQESSQEAQLTAAPDAPEHNDEVERLEAQRLELEAWLEDPTRGADRERRRAERTRSELTGAWLEALDERFEPPQPRFAAVEPPLRLEADRSETGVTFVAPDWPSLPGVVQHGAVVHLTLPDPPSACWLPTMRRRALLAAVRIIMTVLAPRAIQTAAGAGDPPAPFERLDADWWVVSRERFEAHQGVGLSEVGPS
jgi:ATPase subunit of ABC transporter with duplicated ATPase domains